MRDVRFSIFVLVISAAIAACGGAAGAAPTPQAPTPQAPTAQAPTSPAATDDVSASGASDSVLEQEGGLCKYVPFELAEQALGGPPTAAEVGKSYLGLGHYCRATLNADMVLDVERSDVETIAEFKEGFETAGFTDEQVTGLGDLAYRAKGTALGGPGARLAAFTGDHHLAVTITGAGDQETQFAAAEAIVRALIEVGL